MLGANRCSPLEHPSAASTALPLRPSSYKASFLYSSNLLTQTPRTGRQLEQHRTTLSPGLSPCPPLPAPFHLVPVTSSPREVLAHGLRAAGGELESGPLLCHSLPEAARGWRATAHSSATCILDPPDGLLPSWLPTIMVRSQKIPRGDSPGLVLRGNPCCPWAAHAAGGRERLPRPHF